jgi:hypothetical protein
VALCVYSDRRSYLLKVLKIDLPNKVYYGIWVSCLGEGRNWIWMAKESILWIDLPLYTNPVQTFFFFFFCDWQAVIAQTKSKNYNEKSAQYCEAAYWDRYNFHGMCEVKKEFYKFLDQGTSKKAGEWNIEGDTRIMTLWLIPNLYEYWRSHEWGLMGNEVTSDHGDVLSFYVYPLFCWEDSDESIPMV